MQVTQSNSILTVLSDPITLTTNATYEVSGFIKNLTHTGGDSVRFRMNGLTDEIETLPLMVPTSSGSTFTYLIKALSGATTQFAIDFYGENTTFQVDNLSIRQKTGVNLNPRTNEVFLFANYTGNSVDYSCPGGGVVCAEYVDFSNASQNWNTTPITVGAYASQLIFWNNSPYVLRPPTCSLVPDR